MIIVKNLQKGFGEVEVLKGYFRYFSSRKDEFNYWSKWFWENRVFKILNRFTYSGRGYNFF